MEAAEGFIGYYVSLQCDNDSTYEGEVKSIDPERQLITLTHAHQMTADGRDMKFPQITLTGNHVNNLKIIRQKLKIPDLNQHIQDQQKSEKNKKRTSPPNRDPDNTYNSYNNTKPAQQQRKKSGTFTSQDASEISMFPDFDFQQNNARFDKQAVYEKMLQETDSIPNPAPLYDPKMRSQDNILESEPVSLRQIQVPLEHAGKEFATEDGFIIPAITLSLKMKLYAAAEKAGLSIHQLVETSGICVSQMAIQLVGGALRLNPKNSHQRPEIVVLAGCHTQGLQAICTARHLANHRCKVVLYFPNSSPELQPQINLFQSAGGKIIKSTRELPSQPVDMIIDAMVGHENHQPTPWLPYAVSWANQNKAPVMSIDPCIPNSKVDLPNIKWAISLGLPLIKSPTPGRLYLADLGIPRGVFRDAGIQYVSPFKDKFCIPLYES
ncbi:enhancer of mRNA-decapping protein 3-like [Clytia hemisphaerica]|uniref:Enhancer of mRNA-decapping protein 3 n=1 Tax=Clytia hemisphaerica TaxID=252671 RepID=A0A7M5WZX2_9CNID|eukprot:TCONS_00012438-protein